MLFQESSFFGLPFGFPLWPGLNLLPSGIFFIAVPSAVFKLKPLASEELARGSPSVNEPAYSIPSSRSSSLFASSSSPALGGV